MAKIKIEDGSGDKDFFTIIPNYIKNHSTANDQSLYLQMKGFAGEEGKCFATEKTLMERMGVGKKAFNKSLNYLLEKKWIRFVGMTEGKTRPIKSYRIERIWELNNEHYKKIPSETAVSLKEISSESTLSFKKDKFQKEGDKFQKHYKISAESTIEEEQRKEKPEKDNISPKGDTVVLPKPHGNKYINELIFLLKEKNGGFIDGAEQENRNYRWSLLQKFKYKEDKDRARTTIEQIINLACDSPFHSKNATSFKYLYYNSIKIVAEGKNKGNKIYQV